MILYQRSAYHSAADAHVCGQTASRKSSAFLHSISIILLLAGCPASLGPLLPCLPPSPFLPPCPLPPVRPSLSPSSDGG